MKGIDEGRGEGRKGTRGREEAKGGRKRGERGRGTEGRGGVWGNNKGDVVGAVVDSCGLI